MSTKPTTLTIATTTHGKLPRLPWVVMKKKVLGEKYVLNLVFIADYKARKLNEMYRHKAYTPNVLSFPISRTEGEIYINLSRVMREAKRYNMTPHKFAGYLFIHGMLHLCGISHGSRMDKAEKELCTFFSLR